MPACQRLNSCIIVFFSCSFSASVCPPRPARRLYHLLSNPDIFLNQYPSQTRNFTKNKTLTRILTTQALLMNEDPRERALFSGLQKNQREMGGKVKWGEDRGGKKPFLLYPSILISLSASMHHPLSGNNNLPFLRSGTANCCAVSGGSCGRLRWP